MTDRGLVAELAQRIATAAEATIAKATPARFRVVVIVTDEAGDFVGVGSNTPREDTLAILACAAIPVDHTEHGAVA